MPYNTDATENRSDFLLEPLDTPQRQRSESSHLIDLRKQPRFDTQLPAEAVAERRKSVYVFITNISLSGMRLEGSRQMLTALFREDPLSGHTPSIVRVSFALPDETSQPAPVKVHCRSVYVRRDRKDTYQIGMEIVEFDEGKAAFTAYLAQRKAEV